MSDPILTVRERIHAKLVELLASGLAEFFPEGIQVERNRDSAFQKFPAINVIETSEDTEAPESTGFSGYVATVTIEGFVQVRTDAEIGPARNELLGRVQKVVMKNRQLQHLAIDITEGSKFFAESRRENQGPVAGFSVDFDIQYWTGEGDPYELGPGA